MSFGDVIRSAAAPSGNPSGIGGWGISGYGYLYHCNFTTARSYELYISDFSVKRFYTPTGAVGYGIGGGKDLTLWYSVIWYCSSTTIYELDNIDFSIVRSVGSPASNPQGIGGDKDTIWHCNLTPHAVYELSTTDFSVIRSSTAPGYWASGIGGSKNVIWHCSYYLDNIYELSTTDFSVVQQANSPSARPQGIGGDENAIWHCDYGSSYLYELDTGVLSPNTISGNIKDQDGNNLNNVTITLEDGTNYSTSTDISGNYSQLVDADTYTVTASLTGYLSSSALVDASSADQTQNFTLSKPVISGNVSNILGQNLEDITIVFTDDVSYETTTDSNGDYTQKVNADIYDVVASLMGNPDQSTSVDASSSDKTQNFVFPINIAPHDKGIHLKSRYLLED